MLVYSFKKSVHKSPKKSAKKSNELKLKLKFHIVENNPDWDNSKKVKINQLSQKTIESLKKYIKYELTEGLNSFGDKNVKAKSITYKLDKNKTYFKVDAVFKQYSREIIVSIIETISHKSIYQMDEVKQDGHLYSFSHIEIVN
jgi:hypothetical protein